MLSTLIGAVIGLLGTILGGWLSRSGEIEAKKNQRVSENQYNTWKEMQDAFEGLDNAIGRKVYALQHPEQQDPTIRIPQTYFAEPTFRVRLLAARVLDQRLKQLGTAAADLGSAVMAAADATEVTAKRIEFLKAVNDVNDRIGDLILRLDGPYLDPIFVRPS